jgi:hypothetical protein
MVPGYTNVYDIGVPGYGLRLSQQNSSGTPFWYVPSVEKYSYALGVYWIAVVYFTGEIIKTSNAGGSGPINPWQYAILAGDGNTVFVNW